MVRCVRQMNGCRLLNGENTIMFDVLRLDTDAEWGEPLSADVIELKRSAESCKLHSRDRLIMLNFIVFIISLFVFWKSAYS